MINPIAFICFFYFIFGMISLSAQESCTHNIKGVLIDRATEEVLEYAYILIQETGEGAITDSLGEFELTQLCDGEYHFSISHIGCETEEIFFSINSDTTVKWILEHHSEVLSEVSVVGSESGTQTTQVKNKIRQDEILNSDGKQLGLLIADIPGVSSLSTGVGIAKPVIQGNYGNRIAIIKDGINLSSQRWGNDHSPEIASTAMESIIVVKGAETLEFGGEGLGGAVVLKSGSLPKDPHWHGNLNYHFESNGLAHIISTQAKKRFGKWGVRTYLGGQVKGDSKAPNYFLTNTGSKNYYGGLGLIRSIDQNNFLSIKINHYQNEIGILRGSHIGNINDLKLAFERSEPYFTDSVFHYNISAPRQNSRHSDLNISWNRQWSNQWNSIFQYSIQNNRRKEYDVRRQNRSAKPSLDLSLVSHQLNMIAKKEVNHIMWKFGLQSFVKNNINDVETGIFPILPDYRSFQNGIFCVNKRKVNNWTFEAGARYDFHFYSSIVQNTDALDSFTSYRRNYHQVTSSLGGLWEFNKNFNWSINAGFSIRPPAINELFSNGLHQGVAGIEEGNVDLKIEKSTKVITKIRSHFLDHVWLEASAYGQHVDDYIYLRPEKDYRLTIRGAFPVYQFVQSDVILYGFDYHISYPIHTKWEVSMKGSFIDGIIIESKQQIIGLPQDEIKLNLNYNVSHKLNFSIHSQYIFKENGLSEDQDFLPPPDGYFLIGAEGQYQFNLGHQKMTASLSVSNILNESYRSYLNRWRYFADEQGFNMRAGLRWAF